MEMHNAIKLLTIDDRPDILTALCAAVREALPQTTILTATDGPTGIALAAAEDPDVILLGIAEPGMDGCAVCRRLKIDAQVSEIPVVFLIDCNSDAASRVKALEAGAEGFLHYPLDPAELNAQLRAMVKIKAANRSQQIEKAQLEALVAERTQALQASDDRFRVAQDMSPDGFTILHPLRSENGEIVDFTWVYENLAIARINGTDPEEVKGKRLLDLFPTHEGTALWETYTDVADTGQPQTIEEVYVGEIVSRPTWLRLIVVAAGEDIAILAHDITDRKQAEEERRKSEERLKAAERMALLGSWELDIVTNVLTWSDEIFRIFEIDPAQFDASFEAFLNAIHPDDRDAVNQAYSTSLETRTNYAIDHRLLMPDGRVKHVHEQCITFYGVDGRAVRSVGTVHDITERKRAEESLRQASDILNNMQIGLYVYELENLEDDRTLRMVAANPASERLTGVASEELIGKTIDEIFPYLRELEVPKRFADVVRTGIGGVFEDIYYSDDRVLEAAYTVKAFPLPNHRVGVTFDNITERKRAEVALRKSQEEYRSLLQNVQVGVVAHAPDSSILFSNLRASQLLGLTSDQMRGKTAVDEAWHFVREDETRMPQEEYPVNQVLATHQPLTNLTLGIHRPDREGLTWVQCNAHPDWDVNGKLQQVVVSFADITARKQAEQALQESESRLRAIGDNLPAASIYQLRVESNGAARFTYVSAGVEQLHECTVEEALGDSSLMFNRIHPEDVPGWMARTEKSARELSVYDNELRICRKSGEIRWHRMVSRPRRTADGATLFDGVDIDVTKRKRAEEERERLSAEIRAQARQMAQILATVPAGVLLLDAAGQVLQANTVAAGDLAVLAGVAVGDTLTRLGDRPLAELLTPPPTKGVWHEVKSAGRTFEVIARPVEDDPEPALWVLVINDVTREREIQAQLQQQAQLAAVGQLAAGIAHDFNNIMAVIVLYTQLGLSMADVPPKLHQRLEVILEQSHRARDLIQQIVDFSRRSVLERRPLDLLLFLKETVTLLERTLPESISIELAYGEDEYTVGADPTRMQQAIMNLATNARDAMLPQGGGELRIALSRTAATDIIRCVTCGQIAGEEWVCIAVTDSGGGIPPEALSHIFEPFFTTKEVGKGTGLGLAQVYGIVKQHEGHIDVVTDVGQGTTFNLYLPARPVQPPKAPAHEKQAPIQGQGETVLLVEDNAALRDALAGILEELNYRTLQAASGRQALAVLEQRAGEIALVLSDLVMPEMGGQALFHALRQRGLTLPVVILSGHPAEDELKALQAQGLAGWMLKPPDARQLGQLLAQVLHKEPEPG